MTMIYMIKHVTLQKIVAPDFRYDPRNYAHKRVFISEMCHPVVCINR